MRLYVGSWGVGGVMCLCVGGWDCGMFASFAAVFRLACSCGGGVNCLFESLELSSWLSGASLSSWLWVGLSCLFSLVWRVCHPRWLFSPFFVGKDWSQSRHGNCAWYLTAAWASLSLSLHLCLEGCEPRVCRHPAHLFSWLAICISWVLSRWRSRDCLWLDHFSHTVLHEHPFRGCSVHLKKPGAGNQRRSV